MNYDTIKDLHIAPYVFGAGIAQSIKWLVAGGTTGFL